MKKLSFYTIVLFLIISCDKLSELTSINFDFANGTTEFEIPMTPAGSYGSLSSKQFQMNLDSAIKANNAKFAIQFLKTISIKSIDLTLLNPDSSNNFQNISACTMRFASNVKPDTITIGSLSNIPDTYSSALNVPVNTSINVKEYAQTATSFMYVLQADLRKATTKPITCKVKVNYNITCSL